MSLLGLVLMAASAVTAAVLNEKSDKNSAALVNGSLTQVGTNDGVTCTVSAPDVDPCNASTFDAAGSNTSDTPDSSNLTVSGNNGNTTTNG